LRLINGTALIRSVVSKEIKGMARGGFRVGSGRRPGSKTIKNLEVPPGDLTGIQYLQRLVNDQSADPLRRDRAAQILAAIESRAGDLPSPGKKQTAQRVAQTAGLGTDWGSDLMFRQPAPPGNGQTTKGDWADIWRPDPNLTC
jgi:hypothetical protein